MDTPDSGVLHLRQRCSGEEVRNLVAAALVDQTLRAARLAAPLM